jgi:hypothetical protein
MTIHAVYADGIAVSVISNYTLSWEGGTIQDGNTAVTAQAGIKTITVTWQGHTGTFTITVLPATTTSKWTQALAIISADSDGTSSSPKVYTLEIQGNVSVPGVSSVERSITGNYKTVCLTGSGTLSLSSQGSIFLMVNRQTLVIDGPTLSGMTGNNSPIIYNSGGTVELRNGTISGNSSSWHSGVYVDNSGTFTMSGGAISNNTTTDDLFSGGGVSVGNYGTFTMLGGAISNNPKGGGMGGGVQVRGTFSMQGGTISGNTATYGGGVAVVGYGTFTMSGGFISNNPKGGGVHVQNNGTFTMHDGTISGNTSSQGGGVAASNFTMLGGTISGNTSGYGGGVSAGNFTMSGGIISGNTADYGGGVYVTSNGTFAKAGGTVYGDNDGNPDNGNATDNTATNGNTNGHAVYYNTNYSGPSYYRDTTLTAEDNISTDTLPASGTGDNWTKK